MAKLPFDLEVMALAVRYHSWLADMVRPFLGRRILEIGSGIGTMAGQLALPERLILTEIDPILFPLVQQKVEAVFGGRHPNVSVERFNPVVDDAGRWAGEDLDTILSFNVLEHIEDDRLALSKLCTILRVSRSRNARRIVTVVPAHPFAFGSIDRVYGHYRRYSLPEIERIAREVAPEAKLTTCHFNLLGLLGWVFQGRILRRRTFGKGSVRLFELLCPVIRPIDRWIHSLPWIRWGQSVLFVLEFPA